MVFLRSQRAQKIPTRKLPKKPLDLKECKKQIEIYSPPTVSESPFKSRRLRGLKAENEEGICLLQSPKIKKKSKKSSFPKTNSGSPFKRRTGDEQKKQRKPVQGPEINHGEGAERYDEKSRKKKEPQTVEAEELIEEPGRDDEVSSNDRHTALELSVKSPTARKKGKNKNFAKGNRIIKADDGISEKLQKIQNAQEKGKHGETIKETTKLTEDNLQEEKYKSLLKSASKNRTLEISGGDQLRIPETGGLKREQDNKAIEVISMCTESTSNSRHRKRKRNQLEDKTEEDGSKKKALMEVSNEFFQITLKEIKNLKAIKEFKAKLDELKSLDATSKVKTLRKIVKRRLRNSLKKENKKKSRKQRTLLTTKEPQTLSTLESDKHMNAKHFVMEKGKIITSKFDFSSNSKKV